MRRLVARLFRRPCLYCKDSGTLPCYVCDGSGLDGLCILRCDNGRVSCPSCPAARTDA